MTGFFLLSGFSLFQGYKDKDFTKSININDFYKKRLINLLPAYYAIMGIYVLFYGKETVFENIILLPAELLVIQSWYTSLFDVTHNGGTWFISCILPCYLLYPFLQTYLRQLNTKSIILIVLVCVFILLYSPFLVKVFHLAGIYPNPFFRVLEFLIGIGLAIMKPTIDFYLPKVFVEKSKVFVLLEMLLLILLVTFAYQIGIAKNYMLYSWIALPLFILLIYHLCFLQVHNRYAIIIINYISKISYCIFLAQFIVFPVIKSVNISSNLERILSVCGLCLIIATVMHYSIEKPMKKYLQNHI